MFASWIFIAAFSGIFSNASNFFSRLIVKEENDAAAMAWWFELSRLVFFAGLAFFSFSLQVSLFTIGFLTLMGLMEFGSSYIYMKMHQYTHLSISTIISRTRLIWTPIIAYIFLAEHMHFNVYVGIAILFVGLVIATSPKKIATDKSMIFAYVSAFVISVISIMIKVGTNYASPSAEIMFLAFPSVLLFPLT
ncbi:MAG: EamA family transporter, partial [Candidatus Levyibacteriota bacterium]